MRVAARRLLVFFLVAYGGAYGLDALLATGIVPRAYWPPVLVARMCMVALGVFAACRASGLGVRSCAGLVGLRMPRRLRWLLYASLLGAAPYAALVSAAAFAGLEPRGRLVELASALHTPLWALAAFTLAAGIAAGVSINMLAALAEEVGWRGLLHGAVSEKLRGAPGYALVGVAWGLWHAPLVAILGYNYGAGGLDKLAVFTLYTVAVSLVEGLLRDASGSVLPPAAMHGTINGVAGLWIAVYGFRPGDIVAPPAGLSAALAFLAEYAVLHLLYRAASPR